MHLSHTILIFASCCRLVYGSNVTIYLDKVALNNQYPYCRMHDRGNASDKDSFWMFPGDELVFKFCLNETMEVTIMDVLASNDGGFDNLEVTVDGEVKGTVTTIERSLGGQYWNEFIPSGQIGNETRLEPGVHVIVLNLTWADFYGMELDSMVLEFDKNVSADDLRCVGPSGPWGDSSTIKTCDPGNPRIVAATTRKTTTKATTPRTTTEMRNETSTTEKEVIPKSSKSTLPGQQTAISTFNRSTEITLKSTEVVGTSSKFDSFTSKEVSEKATVGLQTANDYQTSSSPSVSSSITENYQQQTTETNLENTTKMSTKLISISTSTTRSATFAEPKVVRKGDNSAFSDYENCRNECSVMFPRLNLLLMTLIVLRFLSFIFLKKWS